MKISTKGQYAVRFMAELATSNNVVSLGAIAKNQGISVKYLEQIVSKLSKAGLIESSRGANGGYKLAKDSKIISIKDILDTTGDTSSVTPCVGGKCNKAKCLARNVWTNLGEVIDNYLSGISLNDLINKKI